MRASNLAIALSQFCSIVTGSTRIRFKWGIKCDEPVVKRRSQYIQARRVCAPEWHFGVGEVARLQGLIGKAGSIRIPSRAKKGKVCGGMRNANATFGTGYSDQVVVPMTTMITSGKRKEPVDTVVAGSGRERPILRKGYRGQTSSPQGDEGERAE